MIITLVPADPIGEVTLETRDLDGDGPNPPEISVSGDLAANSQYQGTVVLLDETENPAVDITEEVEEEGDEHQFFFQTQGINLTFTYDDMDNSGRPIGLQFNLTTGDEGTGGMIVTLRHQPDKDASGVSDGDITNAQGETDLSTVFPITVQ